MSGKTEPNLEGRTSSMGILDGELGQLYRRQQFNSALGGLARGLLQAGSRDAGLLSGAAQGVQGAAQASGGGIRDIAALYGIQRQIDADKQRKATGTRYSQAVGGLDPQTGIDWNTGRPGDPLGRNLTPDQTGLLRAIPPETGMGLLGERAFNPKETFGLAESPYGLGGVGQVSSTTGEIKGYQKPTPQYSGETLFDQGVGKHYQVNPKTGKREYTSPLSGMEITTPDGTTIRTGVSRGGPTGNRRDEIGAARDSADMAISKLDNIQQAIADDPSRAGVVGAARGLAQRIAGMAADVSQAVGESFGVDLGLGKVEPGLKSLFDPTLPEMDVLENSLSYALARARKPTGKLNLQDVESARKDVRLKGVRDVAAVRVRLQTIRREFEQAKTALGRRLGNSGRNAASPYRQMSDEEIRKRLKREGVDVAP